MIDLKNRPHVMFRAFDGVQSMRQRRENVSPELFNLLRRLLVRTNFFAIDEKLDFWILHRARSSVQSSNSPGVFFEP